MIYLVEDDPTIRELVAEKLRATGYDVETSAVAEPFLETLPEAQLFIVDVQLAGRATGLDLCERIRRASPTLPVLVLSARSEPVDRVEGLRRGADDYLTKPFEMEELLLRVSGMLKRRSWYARLPFDSTVFRWSENAIDFANWTASREGVSVELSEKECMLMKLLVEREGEIVSRDEILDRVWGYHSFPSTRTVDNFILRLRKVFEPDPKKPKYIHSARGMGYKFCR